MIGIRCAEKTAIRYMRWVVKLRRCGKESRKNLDDGTSGGKDIGLKMAQAWRDRIVEEHAPMPLADFCDFLRSNNTSGIAGVYFLQNFVAELSDVPHFVKHAAKQMLHAAQQEKEKRGTDSTTRSKTIPANKIKTVT
ncbi:MAG: hypothetical protein ABI171_20455 [Collimonas sp.]|uniref:hypothetical protein n=1 Tax=Collimonas sp. TaxID=1963772 RepID=UPI003266D2AE